MFKTSRFHIENYIFLPFIRLFWEPFSGKRSHWWNWSSTGKKITRGVIVNGDPTLHPLRNMWDNFVQLNLKWHTLILLEPVNYVGEYQLVYKNIQKEEICSVIAKNTIACLRNHINTEYTGYSYPDGEEIQLKMVEMIEKKNLPKGILFI